MCSFYACANFKSTKNTVKPSVYIALLGSGVNFIDILRAPFLYKSLFGSFSLVTCKRKKKLCEALSYEKGAFKMLMKLTPARIKSAHTMLMKSPKR